MRGMLKSATEVVETDVFRGHTPIVAHLQHRLVHHGRAAEVKFDVLRRLVVLEVVVNHRVVDKSEEAVALVVDVLLLVPVVSLRRLGQHQGGT